MFEFSSFLTSHATATSRRHLIMRANSGASSPIQARPGGMS